MPPPVLIIAPRRLGAVWQVTWRAIYPWGTESKPQVVEASSLWLAMLRAYEGFVSTPPVW